VNARAAFLPPDEPAERCGGDVAPARGVRLKVLLVHPGASSSTADIEAGLRYGLARHGLEVIRYRLDVRIDRAVSWLYASWRRAVKENPTLPRPTSSDMVYQAGIGALEMALRHQVDAVLVVSAMFVHPDVIVLMKRAGLRVTVLFTESPYDLDNELKIAAMVDGCWTNERTSVERFRAVNTNARYLPHAWHPQRHYVEATSSADVPSHDVVFVGSGFPERIAWLNAIDWSGIDLGLYGTWTGLGLKKALKPFVRAAQVDNSFAAALYRRAKIGLNLYRTSIGWGQNVQSIVAGESLSPRAYELAACGRFSVSDYRAEVAEVFGELVPTFRTPVEAAALVRAWLPDDAGRARVAAQLPGRVAQSSWVERAACVVGDLEALMRRPLR
jgi:spore maturation protein CgeB